MAEKRIQVFQIMPGTKLLEDIYYNNELVIGKGTVLNQAMISRLKKYQIYQLLVEVEEVEIIQEQEIDAIKTEEENLYYKKVYELKKSKEFQKFEKVFVENIAHVEKIFLRVIENKEQIETNVLLNQIEQILSNGRNGFHILEMMSCVKQYDDITFAHCLNVGMLCNVIGKWIGKKDKELETLTLCGILHDIGKLMIPSEIIDKNGKLTNEEYELVKTHTTHGYQILKNQNLDDVVKYAALMHHERIDGSGYPQSLGKSKIDEYSKIVSIADVYDAMTANRSYRRGMCPFRAISIMEAEGFQKYEATYLIPFLKNTAEAYVNMPVQLSDGRKGKIIKINPYSISKPLVLTESGFVDLTQNKDITITEILV